MSDCPFRAPRLSISLLLSLALSSIGFAEALPVANNRPGDVWSGNSLGMKFRWCPAGSFRMGSPAEEPDRSKDEGQVDVTLTHGFWLGECEVTRGQWERVMSTTWKAERDKRWAYDRIGERPGELEKDPDGPDLPMTYVNYERALAFCDALTKTERKAGRLADGWQYHLPTEAQWEYACRAGTTTRWSFGNDIEQVPKYVSRRKLRSVGELLPNAWGLRDVHGNVEELVRDGYAFKLPGGKNPFTPPKGRSSCYRGGDYMWGEHTVRSAERMSEWFGRRMHSQGFRVALVPLEEEVKAK